MAECKKHNWCETGMYCPECTIDQLREDLEVATKANVGWLNGWENQKYRAEKAEVAVERLTVSRDQWKDACLDSNDMVQRTESQNKRILELLDKAVIFWQIGKWTEPVGLDVLVEQAVKGEG